MKLPDGIFSVKTPFWGQNFVRCGLVVGKYGSLLVDSGTVSTYENVINFMNQMNIDIQSLNYVIATHGHADHMGANSLFRSNCESKIVANVRTVPRCLDYDLQFRMFYGAFPDIYRPSNEEKKGFFGLLAAPCPVDIQIIGDGSIFDLGGKELNIFEAPGHTIGHIIVYESNTGTLFTSDSVAWRGPFNEPPYYENKSDYLNTLDKILNLEINFLITGHFPLYYGNEAKEIIKESIDQVHEVDDIVFKFMKNNRQPHGIDDIAKYLCKILKKDYYIQGLFTVKTHLDYFVEKGFISAIDGNKYVYN